MNKQKGLGLIGLILIIGVLLLTAGGVGIVWERKVSQIPLPASPTIAPPLPTGTSPVPTQPSMSETLTLPSLPPITDATSNFQTIIGLKVCHFDPLVGTPSFPPELSMSYPPNTLGLHIIQLRGSIQDTWLSQIKNSGVEVLTYVPQNSYLVRMTPEQANLVRKFDFVRWVGVYHPGYRISPGLSGSSGKIPITVQIYDDGKDTGGTVDKTIKVIESLGGEFLSQGKVLYLVNARFKIFAPKIISVAQLNEAIWIERTGTPVLFSE